MHGTPGKRILYHPKWLKGGYIQLKKWRKNSFDKKKMAGRHPSGWNFSRQLGKTRERKNYFFSFFLLHIPGFQDFHQAMGWVKRTRFCKKCVLLLILELENSYKLEGWVKRTQFFFQPLGWVNTWDSWETHFLPPQMAEGWVRPA